MGGSVSHEKKGSMPDYVIKRDKEGRVDQNKLDFYKTWGVFKATTANW